jgi:ribose transport system substrate-binding protein
MRSITRGGVAVVLAGAMAVASVGIVVAQDEETEVAYLSASSANTWLNASRAEMEKVAAENGIKMTEFDGQFDPGLALTQLQDVIADGRYAGIIVNALVGTSMLPDLQIAAENGMKLVVLNQVVGDRLDTADPQDPIISASVLAPPLRSGERLGQLALMACEGLDPCNVVYFYGIKGTPIDDALKMGFDAVTAGSTVNIVAEADGNYLGPDIPYAAMQDILVRTQDVDVFVGADQSAQAVELAFEEKGLLDDVSIIGFGGASTALAAVADGRWFGELMGVPGTEGRLAMEAMVEALAGNDVGGIDPAVDYQDEGLVTADNAADFTAEWDG